MALVNAHIHTPHSFSAFESVEQAVDLAAKENIAALGISDFNTVEGFAEFDAACRARHIHPLFCIEFIGLSDTDKKAGRRFNDPKNPGVMYICGKALQCPAKFSQKSIDTLRGLYDGSQEQMRATVVKLNQLFALRGIGIALKYETILEMFARRTVRERHVARAVYHALGLLFSADALAKAYCTLFDDRAWTGDTQDAVRMQNEIRDRLLKAGKPAFVEERPDAFLTPERVRELILDGGGIPCYPVLADDVGGLTEFENDPQRLAEGVAVMGFHAVEFIPSRNTFDHLKRYVATLHSRGLLVTFGTEHNTPAMTPLVPTARGGVAFDGELASIAWEGACVLAAHQQCIAEGGVGYVDDAGNRTDRSIRELAECGAGIIG